MSCRTIHLFVATIVFLIAALAGPGYAQDHLQLHVALAGMFPNSADLDNFGETYNALNNRYLARKMDGMATAVGWRWAAGYRHFDRFNYALTIGMYQVGCEDQARFTNGERREYKLDIRSPFVEVDAGYFTGSYLFNGLLTLYFGRQIRLQTNYVSFDPRDRPLDGVYRGEVDVSIDLGVMAGMIKYPFIITTRISFPVYSSDDGTALSNGVNEFPGDYFSYVGKGAYPGLSADIDGFKIFVTLGYLFQF